jgi:hypothetical protein
VILEVPTHPRAQLDGAVDQAAAAGTALGGGIVEPAEDAEQYEGEQAHLRRGVHGVATGRWNPSPVSQRRGARQQPDPKRSEG